MAGHFPFSGNNNRVGVFAFYERYGLNAELQAKYYKWWFDWAKSFVMADAGLAAAKGIEFAGDMYGHHAHHGFHLNDQQWCTALIDLGKFIDGTIMPKLNDDQLHKLEDDHHHMLDHLVAEAAGKPRAKVGETGWFRHM